MYEYSIRFHLLTSLYLYKYCEVYIILVLQYNLKLRIMITSGVYYYVIIFRVVLAMIGFLCPLMNLKIIISIFVKNDSENLMRTVLNLQIAFGSMVIFAILTLLIHESTIYFHLLIFFQIMSSVTSIFYPTSFSLTWLELFQVFYVI